MSLFKVLIKECVEDRDFGVGIWHEPFNELYYFSNFDNLIKVHPDPTSWQVSISWRILANASEQNFLRSDVAVRGTFLV